MKEKIWEEINKDLIEEQVISILTELGSAPPKKDGNNNLVFQSVCHNSDSWKLCYYPEKHSFFCYRDWESYNLFTLVMQVKSIEFKEALCYVCERIGKRFDPTQKENGFHGVYAKEDWDIFNRFDRIGNTIETNEKLAPLNKRILNLYSSSYYMGWIAEHISIKAMEKYEIKADFVNSRIIIPHFDEDNNLVGIRCRNLNPAAEAKYCPIYLENKLYNHSLSSCLYGLNFNKETIKSLRKAMIVESEKSVLQCESYFPDHNFSVACCGSNISNQQIQLLLGLGVEEIILAMDWDFHQQNDEDKEYRTYKNKIINLCQKLVPYFSVKVLLAPDENFIYKCSPSDLGKDYLLKAMKNKITVNYDTICVEKEKKGGEPCPN